MFSFLDMMSNYEDRKVDNFEEGDLFIDTCAVNDSAKPYETAIGHPNYNDGKLVIVELYDTKEQAQEGHNKWVKIMTTEPLPERLYDASQNALSSLLDMFDDKDWRDKAEL